MIKKRIGVLMGGLSAEREVSLNTGKGVLAALLERGQDAVGIDWSADRDLTELLRKERIELVWIALHGTYGEDGCVQGLLECLKIPYTGSGVLSSALAMDKIMSKRIFERAKVPTPDWGIVTGEDPPEAASFGFPLVIKPSREGSTVGVTIVRKPEELAPAIALAKTCHGEVMIERYIAGREASVGILDDEVVGTVEIRPRREFYDYAAKYQSGDTEYLVPPPMMPMLLAATERACLDAYLALGCKGHARVDVRISEGAELPWVLEVNTLPGMTGTSLLPKIARHRGMDYATLVERILLSAGLRE